MLYFSLKCFLWHDIRQQALDILAFCLQNEFQWMASSNCSYDDILQKQDNYRKQQTQPILSRQLVDGLHLNMEAEIKSTNTKRHFYAFGQDCWISKFI